MIRRRSFLATSSAALLTAHGALAQQTARRPRIGFLGVATREAHTTSVAAFVQGLKDLGYVEGQTIDIDWRYGDGLDDRLPGIAEELVRLAPIAIVATGDSPGVIRKVTTTIPIIATNIPELSATQLVGNIARPSGNVTGVLGLGAGSLTGKQIEI